MCVEILKAITTTRQWKVQSGHCGYLYPNIIY